MAWSDVLLSATQIELFRDCKRKWGFKYLDRIVTPPNAAALLGTEVQDEQLDPYLLTGRVFDFTRPSGEIAQKLVPLLPAPVPTGLSPGLVLRRKFLMPSSSGEFGYRGEFDLWAPDSGIVPGLGPGKTGVALLGDIKTSGNLRYAKTDEKLLTDLQAELYAMAVMFEDNVDLLDAVWFYTRTRGALKAERHYVRLTASHVAEQFRRIDELGRACAEVKTAHQTLPVKAADLEPNPRMCDEYGGCQFRHVCNLSPAVHSAAVNNEERERAIMNTAQPDFLAKLRRTVAPETASATPTIAPAPQMPEPDWVTEINPPESDLPPAPPVGSMPVQTSAETLVAATAQPEKRTRRTKVEIEAGKTVADAIQVGPIPSMAEVISLASTMKAYGIKRLAFMSGQVHELELFKSDEAPAKVPS